LARYYIVIERAIRETDKERRRLKRSTMTALGAMPAVELLKHLGSHQADVAHCFRKTLTGPLRKKAQDALGFSDADFEHIAKSTPGNPDFGYGGIAQPTGTGRGVRRRPR
jgi:hypothetical protein